MPSPSPIIHDKTFLVLEAELRKSSGAGKPYYVVTLRAPNSQDSTLHSAKLWSDTISVQMAKKIPMPAAGQVWYETAYAEDLWQGDLQLNIRSYKVHSDPTPEILLQFETPSTVDVDSIINDLFFWEGWKVPFDSLFINIGTELKAFGFWDKLLTIPAGVRNHHSFRGGLLQHLWEMVSLAHTICGVSRIPDDSPESPSPDFGLLHFRDLVDFQVLRAAIILHDIAKVHDYNMFTLSYEGDDISNLIEHSQEAILLLERNWPNSVRGIEYYNEKLLMTQHCVLSHHGKGVAAVPPKTPEAMILHHLDAMSAYLDVFYRSEKDWREKNITPQFNKMMGITPYIPKYLPDGTLRPIKIQGK